MAANHTTQGLLEHGTSRLADASDSAGLDAELLLAHVLNVPRARFRSHPEDVPDAAARALYLELIERRMRGEPLAYIVGHRDFWTLTLAITPAVLVPRPETELLVERALALRTESTGKLLDLGTGSGAIALALASVRPGWQVTATDLSVEALAVARSNATRHDLTRVEFLEGNWLEPLAGRTFDLIVSNPPYIGADEPEMSSPALRFEPRGALTPATSDALSSLHAIVQSAPPHLEPDGWLLLEHGSTQASAVARALVERGFRHVRSHRDLAGHERMTEGQWPARRFDGPIVTRSNEAPMLRFETSQGNFTVELFEKEAPISTKNFLRYVEENHYDGTIFHRVIPGFMVQGGGMEPGMGEKDMRDPIKNEAKNGMKNDRGTLAMARTNVVDSATAQFFINLKDNDFLNHQPGSPSTYGYAVFGKVTEGMDVVDKIAKVKTGSRRGHQDVPVEDVVVTSVRRVEAAK